MLWPPPPLHSMPEIRLRRLFIAENFAGRINNADIRRHT
jgi:hypothetical protein